MGILDFLTQRVDSTKLARTNEKLISLYDEEDKAIQNLWDIRNKIQKAKTDIEQMAKEEAKQQQEQPKPEEKPQEKSPETPAPEPKPVVKQEPQPNSSTNDEEELFNAGEQVPGELSAPVNKEEQTPYGVGGKSKKSKKNKSKKEKKQTQKGGKTRKNKKSQNGGQQLPLSPSEFPDTPLI